MPSRPDVLPDVAGRGDADPPGTPAQARRTLLPAEPRYSVHDGRLHVTARRRWAAPVAIALCALGSAGIAAGQTHLVLPRVEEALTADARRSLDAAGYPQVQVSVDGRDVMVRNVPAEALDAVTRLIQDVNGVHRLSTVVLIAAPPAAPSTAQSTAQSTAPSTAPSAGGQQPVVATTPVAGATPSPGATTSPGQDPAPSTAPSFDPSSAEQVARLASVAATVDRGAVVLYGTVPSTAARDSLAAGLESRFGADAVTSELDVDDAAGDVGLTEFARVVAALGPDTRAGVVTLRGARIQVVGTTATDVTDRVTAEAVAAGGGDARAVAVTLQTAADATTGPATAAEVIRALDALPPILFGTDSSRIRPASRPVVDAAARLLADHPDIAVVVEGHTDGSGIPESNLALSLERAQVVASALDRGGALQTQLDAQGYGATRPLVATPGPLADLLNRRVVLRATAR